MSGNEAAFEQLVDSGRRLVEGQQGGKEKT